MYVNGQLADTDNVLIDIGTGYFVEMVSTTNTSYMIISVTYMYNACEKYFKKFVILDRGAWLAPH